MYSTYNELARHRVGTSHTNTAIVYYSSCVAVYPAMNYLLTTRSENYAVSTVRYLFRYVCHIVTCLRRPLGLYTETVKAQTTL